MCVEETTERENLFRGFFAACSLENMKKKNFQNLLVLFYSHRTLGQNVGLTGSTNREKEGEEKQGRGYRVRRAYVQGVNEGGRWLRSRETRQLEHSQEFFMGLLLFVTSGVVFQTARTGSESSKISQHKGRMCWQVKVNIISTSSTVMVPYLIGDVLFYNCR